MSDSSTPTNEIPSSRPIKRGSAMLPMTIFYDHVPECRQQNGHEDISNNRYEIEQDGGDS
jgi:hypothetical protein